MLRPSLYSLYPGNQSRFVPFDHGKAAGGDGGGRGTYVTFFFKCLLVAAGLGHEQSHRLRRQFVLQHERVGADLGQSGLSCLQLFTKVSEC